MFPSETSGSKYLICGQVETLGVTLLLMLALIGRATLSEKYLFVLGYNNHWHHVYFPIAAFDLVFELRTAPFDFFQNFTVYEAQTIRFAPAIFQRDACLVTYAPLTTFGHLINAKL